MLQPASGTAAAQILIYGIKIISIVESIKESKKQKKTGYLWVIYMRLPGKGKNDGKKSGEAKILIASPKATLRPERYPSRAIENYSNTYSCTSLLFHVQAESFPQSPEGFPHRRC